MGNPVSKLEESTERNKIALDSTPTLATPVRNLELDPRSPSCNIARTPIEILNREVLEETSTGHLLQNRCIKIISTDPRSPTTEFIRTPIVVEANSNYEVKLRNKALDNVKKQLDHSEPNKSTINNTTRYNSSINLKTDLEINKNDETNNVELKKSKSITLVQKNKTDEIDCKSIPGLLETNLDDVLCPIEKIDLTCSPVKHRKKLEKNVLDKEIQTNGNEKDNTAILRTLSNSIKPIQTENNSRILNRLVNEEDGSDNQINSNNIKEISFESKHKKLSETPKNDDMVPKTPNLLSEETKSPQKLISLISPSVVEFNKKLTNLIYEDAQQDDLHQIKIKENCRTPLSTRNCNEYPTKPKLKVSDKPKKLHSGSKIPVLREKKLKENRFSSQCENTPPKSMELVVKTGVTNWDADKTLII